MLGKILVPFAGLSLVASPVLAQSAQPLSVQPALIERAGGAEDGSELAGGSWFPPVLFGLIVIAGVLTATGVLFDDDDDVPTSP